MKLNPLVVTESQTVLSQHARSFSFAAWFLPQDVQHATAVVYAFCRLIDDAVDEALTPQLAVTNLAQIEAELNGTSPARPLLQTFAHVMLDTKMSPQLPRLLIQGVRTDLDLAAIVTQAELIRYSYLVASTVGLMMCAVMKVERAWATPYAIDLGIAMQLTNIARDVKEDGQRNRTYVPKDWWASRERGASPAITTSDVERLLVLADFHYRRARYGFSAIPFGPRCAAAVAAEIYRAIGTVIRRHPEAALQTRVSTSKVEKIFAMLKGLTWAVLSPLRRPPEAGNTIQSAHPREIYPLAGQEMLGDFYGVVPK